INSVRLRIDLVTRFLDEHKPDILCLQETKCPDDKFPHENFHAAGYPHIAARGQPGYHGVAIVSRLGFSKIHTRDFCGKGDARHVSVDISAGAEPFCLHNFYVPAGGDEPNPQTNEKFAHKLSFLNEMTQWFANGGASNPDRQILVGDLNIAPAETDVWSHKQLLKVVSHTPEEVKMLDQVMASAGWVDVVREQIPLDQKIFTWWSYRSRDWRISNRGRRLDHIWATPALAGKATKVTIVDATRDWPQPSDHVPIVAQIAL
ncbi:MAG: exodeoxyribonuclease III, partial [Alphaproteobacteria bacterium]